MIHHLSIPAQDPLHVIQVLVELFDGALSRFGPYGNSYIAWMRDEHGSAIEVFPAGTELLPDAESCQANFRHDAGASGFTTTHATVSVRRTEQQIATMAARDARRPMRAPGDCHAAQ